MAVGGLVRPPHAGDGQCDTLRVLRTLAVRPRRSQVSQLSSRWRARVRLASPRSAVGQRIPGRRADPGPARRRDLVQLDYRSFLSPFLAHIPPFIVK
jgi:hypothetical protein